MIDDLYKQKIELAETGDRDAAKWLLEEFRSTVKQNRDSEGKAHRKPSGIHTQFNEALLDYFSRCFGFILNGVSPDKALGLNKGQPGADSISPEEVVRREHEWCLEVLKLKSSGRYPLLRDAKKQASRKFRVSLSAIEKAWKKSEPKISAEIVYNLEKEGK